MLTDLAKVDLHATIRTGILSGLIILSEHPYLVFAIFLAIFSRLVYLKFFHPLAQFPGPFLAPFSNAFYYAHLLSFSTPSANKLIYGFGTRTLPSMVKDPVFFTPEVDGSLNIINETDKEEHSRMRKMLSFAFSNENLLRAEEVLVRRIGEFLGRLGEGGREREGGRRGVDIVREFGYVSFDIMGEMCFGGSFAKRLQEQHEHRYHWADTIVNTTYMNDIMRAVCVLPGLFTFLEWFPTSHMKATLYRHAAYATEHTLARLKLQTTRKDITHHILTSCGPQPTTIEIASHFNVIMMAGSVTTATFLSGATYYLAKTKPALTRLQTEFRSKFKNLEEMNSRALMECEYLNAVVEEGLRIYPPAGAAHLSRIIPEGGCEIEGRWIPEGTRVSVHQWSILRNPLYFSNPTSFTPERWIKTEPEGQRGGRLETSLPFSYGPRGCLGRNLAYLEMRMILAKIFWQYHIAWFNDNEIDWERDSKGYSLWEKPELRVEFRVWPGSSSSES